ncbi:MAG: YkgJ family cysteine cluster protein, partial [Promethearchaeota archaeon]
MQQNLSASELYRKSPGILKKWSCLQCGFCCKNFKLGVSGDDWERWDGVIVDSKIGKYPLRDFCNLESKKYSKIGDLFFHPETKQKFEICPFLEERNEKFYCLIHDPKIKPTICKEWHTEYIDLRCVRTRQIINEMYELK